MAGARRTRGRSAALQVLVDTPAPGRRLARPALAVLGDVPLLSRCSRIPWPRAGGEDPRRPAVEVLREVQAPGRSRGRRVGLPWSVPPLSRYSRKSRPPAGVGAAAWACPGAFRRSPGARGRPGPRQESGPSRGLALERSAALQVLAEGQAPGRLGAWPALAVFADALAPSRWNGITAGSGPGIRSSRRSRSVEVLHTVAAWITDLCSTSYLTQYVVFRPEQHHLTGTDNSSRIETTYDNVSRCPGKFSNLFLKIAGAKIENRGVVRDCP